MQKPPCKVFYCWQSQSPETNHDFIDQALQKAVKVIRDDDSIFIEPDIDRDIKGLPGSPPIAQTIFAKIETADVFVADITLINQEQDYQPRPMPNPNVLLELGYAVGKRGWERVILVANRHFGTRDLPFDIQGYNIVWYDYSGDNAHHDREFEELVGKLESRIRVTLGEVLPSQSIVDKAVLSVHDRTPSAAKNVRNFMEHISQNINQLAPIDPFDTSLEKQEVNGLKEKFYLAVEKSTDLVINFARLAEAIAIQNTGDLALSLYRGFSPILERFNVTQDRSGLHYLVGFDFHKFIAHELWVSFIACLLREDRWELIAQLLSTGISVRNSRDLRESAVSFAYI